jgi:flagellar biogenesis protein FliO
MNLYHVLEALIVVVAVGLALWYLLRRFKKSKQALDKGSGCGCSCDSCPASKSDETDE